ncbi:MAG: recombinase family protein [Lachnospiraceae bacterium]|nr:recombinase family protein [uncultured Acetatifactor sp.]MCI8286459.1 recombinase family protein [Lachnospiraceae bacterium]
MKIGYVRVSTKEQNTARQEELMKSLGVDKIYIDRLSGKNTDRPALLEMLGFVREGDSVIVESISRFARNTKDLLELTEQLNNKRVQFISQKENIDTDTPAGKFMLTIFGAVAELEREYIRQRQKEGIEIAKEKGKYKGRPAKQLDTFDEIYQQWKSGTITATLASKQMEISRSTFYRKVVEYENENKAIDF